MSSASMQYLIFIIFDILELSKLAKGVCNYPTIRNIVFIFILTFYYFYFPSSYSVLDNAQPQSPQSASAKCLERLHSRQKEIETEERKNTNEKINVKTLHLDDAFCINDDFDKVYVFIPGKKV